MDFIGQKVNLYFDAQRQGYDPVMWTTITGTPIMTLRADAFQFNTASAIGNADIARGELTFFLTIPAGPTSGDVREWGFKQFNSTASATFKITGAVFSAYTSNLSGQFLDTPLTWNAAWTGVPVQFKIDYVPGKVNFYANDVIIATS